MKYFKLSLLFIFCSALLVGCNFFNEQEQKIDVKEVEQEVISEEIPSVFVEDGEEIPQKTFYCNMLKLEGAEVNCLNNVNSFIEQMLEDEIYKTFDLSRCKELPEYKVQDCESYIQEVGVSGPISEEDINLLDEILELIPAEFDDDENIVKEAYYDIAKCSDLKTQGLKEYCEKSINDKIQTEEMYKIIDSDDPSGCDDLSEDYKMDCQVMMGVYEFSEEDYNEEDVE